MPEPQPQPPFIRTESGPLALEFIGHSSVEDYDKDAGTPGSCLETADRWHLHRHTIGVFDEAFSPILLALTQIPRTLDERETKRRRGKSPNPESITPAYESFAKYLDRAYELASPETQKQIRERALEVSRKIKISAAPARRLAPVEVKYYNRADSILSQEVSVIQGRVSKYLALVPDFLLAYEPDSKPNRDSFARLLKLYEEARWANED